MGESSKRETSITTPQKTVSLKRLPSSQPRKWNVKRRCRLISVARWRSRRSAREGGREKKTVSSHSNRAGGESSRPTLGGSWRQQKSESVTWRLR